MIQIDDNYIRRLLSQPLPSKEQMDGVWYKIERLERLVPEEVAWLLMMDSEPLRERLYRAASDVKKRIYGDRVVLFAPLYISNYCVNNCTYCGYRRDGNLPRRKLTMEEIREEVRILERMGHKRLALEVGEDPRNCPLDYVLEALTTIYNTPTEDGDIRRVNVNIAATTVEEYSRLKEAGIGTYILFQETYHRPTYESVHARSLKGNYEYHLNAFTRAMEAGIDDVGAGVLFGLYDWRYELLGLILHNAELEERFGVGFHTVSVPRMKRAEGVSMEAFPYLIDDEEFKLIVALLRVAIPYVGLILSTRESASLRKEMLRYGVTQISAGSNTGVGGYKADERSDNTAQFEVEDTRAASEVIRELLHEGHVPSFCTACYRSGRTGDRFMQLARSGNIHNVCLPNALMTLMEYALTSGDASFVEQAEEVCQKQLAAIENDKMRAYTEAAIERIRRGERDLFV